MGIPMLLSIVEMGGYPDFTSLYRRAGYRPESPFDAQCAGLAEKNRPEVVVAEFHFDPELRDRMSNLESLLAGLQRFAPQAKVIVFIERAHRTRLEKVRTRYAVRGALDYPIEETALEELLNAIATED